MALALLALAARAVSGWPAGRLLIGVLAASAALLTWGGLRLWTRFAERERELAARVEALQRAATDRATLERRFRLLVEGVVDYAIFLLDPDGRIATWNEGAQRLKGYTADEILGQSFAVFYPPEAIAEHLPETLLGRARHEGRASHEGWRLRRDGSRFWGQAVLTALYAQDGTLEGFAKVTRDMTARRQSDVLMDAVMNHVVDGIISVDHAGTIEWFNPAAERMFGYAAREIVGQPLSRLLPELGEPPLVLDSAARHLTARRREGDTFPAHLALNEYRLDEQRHFTGVIRDVTAERRLESQLQQAQKMEAIGLLAGGVAHDFNNLLTVISGYAALLLQNEHPDPDRTVQMVRAIADAGERASSLTRQLLAFSRQAVLEPRVLDLNGVIVETERMLRRLIGEDIRLEAALSPSLPAVRVDPGQMSQVLLNLAVNARDAMPRGGMLTIETAEAELDPAYEHTHPDVVAGRYVRLSVTDTGVGMPPEVQARIFDPFFTTKAAGKGTGLGLATVYGIVRQSGGHIGVYSEINRGTTFKIYLPVVGDASGAPAAPFDPAEVGRGQETILLVEDEEAVREFAVLALQSRGYTVLTARHGEDGVRVYREHADEIDLLITDVVMPGMSGRELAEALRELRPGLRVLYQSGYTDDAVVRHGLLQAEVAFLQKPYTPWSLARKVRQVLDQSPQPITTGD
ncbi:MAG: PAS domain S-box protein [Vicinamibacterales bacterium]